MNPANRPRIGFACAYTPLPLIAAAGFVPYRVLPITQAPEQTGRILHDNLCPHVKSILDRAMAGELPPLAGMVFMNSCDAMRRLYDAWLTLPGGAPAVLIDLPVTIDRASSDFFTEEVKRLAAVLEGWGGRHLTPQLIREGIGEYNALAEILEGLIARVNRGTLADGTIRMQEVFNRAATQPWHETSSRVRGLLAEQAVKPDPDSVSLYLFGNVLPDPEAFRMFADCGARITASDLCSGTRLFQAIETGAKGDPCGDLAAAILKRRPCARTLDPARPLRLAEEIIARARDAGARGVICHTVKFCDPYLARMAAIRRALQEAGIPFLILEGDCTLRAIGQQRTRIEAFVEMLR